MSIKPPPGLTENDYESIEEAVMETARGRWFLREFARRARAADTGRLLEALSRIERVVSGQSALPGGFETEPHARALEERQQRLADIGWTLRERGYDGSICAMIENEARALATLSEGVRGNGPMMEGEKTVALPAPRAPVRDAPPAPVVDLAPPVVATPIRQPEPPPAPVVAVETTVVIAAPPPRFERFSAREATPAPAVVDGRLAALADIDRLPAREKAALFG